MIHCLMGDVIFRTKMIKLLVLYNVVLNWPKIIIIKFKNFFLLEQKCVCVVLIGLGRKEAIQSNR